jgi:hypothetical protein
VPAAQLDATLTSLVRDGVIVVAGGMVELTGGGLVEAWRVVRRHRLTLLMLTDLIGLPWSQAHRLVSAWEPLVDEAVQSRVAAELGQPGVCPYGHPLSSDTVRVVGVLLADAPDGPVRVVSLAPRLVADCEALEILAGCGARPGDDIEIKRRHAGWFEIAGTVRDAALPPTIAGNLTVAPLFLGR